MYLTIKETAEYLAMSESIKNRRPNQEKKNPRRP
jgi:hypothetical protein